MKYMMTLALTLLTACQVKTIGWPKTAYIQTPVTTQPATVTDCPNGGVTYTIGTTVNTICNGVNGSDGASITGPTGSPGEGCQVSGAPNGVLISCAGTTAFIFNGIDGRDGIDTTPVTVVPLCQDTTVYPSVFSEVALCIGDNLFAVYSENNGFLSYIPPGNYVSHGHNSNCNLTIQPHCVVSN